MKRFLTFSAVTLIAATCANGTVIVNEDFESYADTPALGGVWSLSDATLDTASGNPGQSMFHPGTGGSFSGQNTNTMSFSAVSPSASESVLFTADILDDGSSSNKRTTAGLRTAAGANIIEMGMYNGPGHYAYRTILFDGSAGGSNWLAFTGLVDDAGTPIGNDPVAGWHRFAVDVTTAGATFTLDLNSDGNINATAFEPLVMNAAGGFDIIRLGGPSDVSSPGGGVNFDNIGLSTEMVPEPTSIVLLTLSALAIGAVRRR